MGIQKEKILNSGVSGNYWRITSVYIDRQNLQITGEIALFKDQACSNAGMQPMPISKRFSFPLIMAEIAPPTNLIAYVYNKIKAAASVSITEDVLGNTLAVPTTVDLDLTDGVDVL